MSELRDVDAIRAKDSSFLTLRSGGVPGLTLRNGYVGIGTTNPGWDVDVSGVDAIVVPTGTTTEAPPAGRAGAVRLFTDTAPPALHVDNGSAWVAVGSAPVTPIAAIETLVSEPFTDPYRLTGLGGAQIIEINIVDLTLSGRETLNMTFWNGGTRIDNAIDAEVMMFDDVQNRGVSVTGATRYPLLSYNWRAPDPATPMTLRISLMNRNVAGYLNEPPTGYYRLWGASLDSPGTWFASSGAIRVETTLTIDEIRFRVPGGETVTGGWIEAVIHRFT